MPQTSYPVVDGDGHVIEPRQLFTERLAPEYRGPQGLEHRRGADGAWYFYIEGQSFPFGRQQGITSSEADRARFANAIADKFGPESHVQDMDREGIAMAVLYPTYGLGLWGVQDAGLARNWAEVYNTWLAERCQAYPDRLLGVALLPRQDPAAMVRELERAVGKLGHKAAMIFPNLVNGRRLDDPAYEPFYAEVERARVPLAIHIGGFFRGQTVSTDRFSDWFNLHIAGHPLEMMLGSLALISGGVLDRHPDLQVAFLESGTGWLPFWLDRIHEHQEVLPEEAGPLQREALDVFRAQCYIGFEADDSQAPYVARCVGAERLLYASDYPHFDAKFPDSVATVLARPDLTDEQKRLMLSENAIRFYGLEELARQHRARLAATV